MRKSIKEETVKSSKLLQLYTHIYTYILVLNNKIKKYIEKDRIMRKTKKVA